MRGRTELSYYAEKAVLKQQFEAFSISNSEGLEKGYDRFQQLLSQLEAHGAEVSTEDANHNKVGLGYEIKSNNEVLSYEEEMNRSMFKCTAEDYINKPLYSRFTKTNSFKGVPHPLTRDYTPKPQEEGKFDDSFEVPVEYSEHSSEVLNQKSIIQLNAVRKNVNSVRPNVNTGRVNVNSIRHNVKSVRINVNIGRSKQPVPTCNSNSFSPVRPQGNWGTTVKTTAGYNWRNSKLNSNCDSGPTFIRTMNAKGPQGRPKPEKAWCMLRAHDVQETKLVATSTIEAEYVAAASCCG
ncbi:hypothetical protein Tco_1032542 [Tanacetum coccineum]|uniref:Uncharacterized protein n=1 Tax=Tanacetum coccineum TaxID=301880 RepID=A0ABQ5GDI7_9ASTR